MRARLPLTLALLSLLLGLPGLAAAGSPVSEAPAPPDLTQGGKPDNKHRWTLGATGARGWVWSRYVAGGSENTDARQILITEVAKGSPADGVLQDGDVIVGINGQPFDGNARILFAKALTEAETGAKRGVLKLVRWRAGKTEDVQLKLKVLGTYAPTAPYGCAKSKRIFEQGCEAIAQRGFRDKQGNVQVSIENDLNALALLASSCKQYRPLVAEYARKVAEYQPQRDGLPSWEYAYNTLFLAEYILATKDEAVMPPMRSHDRHRVKSRLTAVNGLDAIHARLSNRGGEESEAWVVDDVSLGGMGAQVPLTASDWVRIGALLGMQPEGGSNWLVGVVRRFSRETPTQGSVGIETLSKSPQAIVGDLGGMDCNAILLDTLHTGDTARVILPSAAFEPAIPLVFAWQGRSARLDPIEQLETGVDFDLGLYRAPPG